PFNVPVTSYMKLTNPSDKKVMFKIKTTAPKKYCVRPNSGSLDSNASVEIASKYSALRSTVYYLGILKTASLFAAQKGT
ncbi:hypothetical protein Trydic_g12495, partial [Trypoxylus dichotomus]